MQRRQLAALRLRQHLIALCLRQHPVEYPSGAAASSTLQTHRLPRCGNIICHLTPTRRPGCSLIRRRYAGGVGNRCRWAERFAMSEQRQSMERHFQRSRELFRTDRGRPCPREWEDPQAKRCGGMERSGSLCGRVAAPRETLHRVPWREPLQQFWKATCRQGASSGSSCRQG